MDSRHRWLFVLLGLAMVAVAVRMGRIENLAASIPAFLVHFGVFFAAYCASLIVIHRVRAFPAWVPAFVFAVALLCRLAFLGGPPSLSDDIYRYLWEGKVVAAGRSPFALPPTAPELEFLRDENYEGVSHKHMETIYPPLAQGVFALGAVIHPDVRTLKVIFVVFDLATMVLLYRLLVLRRRKAVMCAVYGWSPLVILEFSHSGHVDALGIFFLILAVYLFERYKALAGTVSLGLSFLAKYLTVMLLPFLLFKKRLAPWLIAFVLIAVAGYLPFADASGSLLSSLRTYGRYWEFNSALFSVAKRLVGHPDVIRAVFAGGAVLFSVHQGYRRKDFTKYAYRVIACLLLVTPTFYPWYLCWLIPFLCFFPRRSWIYLSGAVVLSYWVWVRVESTGVWDPGHIVMVCEWVPFFCLLAAEAFHSFRERRIEVV